MQHAEGRFPGVGELDLYYQSWLPESAPRAVVALVHGVGEHSGRYMNVVGPLVDAGYAVYGYDHRGHGKSPGPRVHISSWSQYRDDLTTYLGVIAEEMPSLPVVIYGHSMGSLVVLDYLLEQPDGLAGAIISGIAIEPVGVGSPATIVAAKVLSGVVPRLSVSLKIDASALTRDPEAMERFRSDPMLTDRATVRWGAESLKTVERVKGGLDRVDVPLLVLHGEADPLNSVSGAHALHETAMHPDKTLCVYPEARHEPHNDLCHAELASDVISWLDRVAAGSDSGE